MQSVPSQPCPHPLGALRVLLSSRGRLMCGGGFGLGPRLGVRRCRQPGLRLALRSKARGLARQRGFHLLCGFRAGPARRHTSVPQVPSSTAMLQSTCQISTGAPTNTINRPAQRHSSGMRCQPCQGAGVSRSMHLAACAWASAASASVAASRAALPCTLLSWPSTSSRLSSTSRRALLTCRHHMGASSLDNVSL